MCAQRASSLTLGRMLQSMSEAKGTSGPLAWYRSCPENVRAQVGQTNGVWKHPGRQRTSGKETMLLDGAQQRSAKENQRRHTGTLILGRHRDARRETTRGSHKCARYWCPLSSLRSARRSLIRCYRPCWLCSKWTKRKFSRAPFCCCLPPVDARSRRQPWR